ncbi:MAG: trypsin-like peptidase domain-containing protein [Hydrogenophaga sp.]|uniref:S1C family serine protease n=1 Tax=Hydrogenophaga sp. TaxID=1904254 RepID=UPI001D3CF22C|nr:serine protease [Hydrogenophaga sp.]MBX3609521.1 trypsin-like peptidase domain-containing protein [Hydrogenophaga sp.]
MRRHTLLLSGLVLGISMAQAQPVLTPETLFERVAPSVWTVRTADTEGRPLTQGSAVVIGPGRLITNCHVLRRAARVSVGRENVSYGAELEHPDTERDLCQLKVANFSAPPVTIAPPESLRVGARVYAIGAPRGLETTISDGLLSGIRRNQRAAFEALQITVPVSPGSSGGGLFDAYGRLIGITSFVLKDSQNLNFAVPASWIAEVPERAQAAQAARNAPPPDTGNGASSAAATAASRVFEYRLTDRSTGNFKSIVYRLDRVEGDRMVFNNGDRIEREGGGVIENKQPLGGEFDLVMPPGGWVSSKPELGAAWRLDYKSRLSYGSAHMELRARATETSSMRIGTRDFDVVVVRFEGYTTRSTAGFSSYKASAWYAPALGRVVRFEAKAHDRYIYVDEALELVDIRSE